MGGFSFNFLNQEREIGEEKTEKEETDEEEKEGDKYIINTQSTITVVLLY